MSDDQNLVQMEEQKQKNTFFKDLMRERRKEKSDDMNFLPAEMHREQMVSEEMETPVLDYSDVIKRIMHRDYDKKGLSKWKHGQSKDMKKVTETVAGVYTLLNGLVDMDQMEEQLTKIKEQYAAALSACSTYLRERNPRTAEGKARYELVQAVSDRLFGESRLLDFNVETFKKQYTGEKETWGGIISEAHRQFLKDGENGVKIGGDAGPGCTSEINVYIEGDKKYFFKKEEKSLPNDREAILSDMKKSYKEEMRQLMLQDKGLYKGVSPEQRKARIDFLAQMVKNLNHMLPVFEDMDLKDGRYVGARDKWVFSKYKELTKDLTEEDFLAFESVYKDFVRRVTQSLATHVAKIEPGAELSKRNEATSLMADLLGVSDMMMSCQRVNLSMDGSEVQGLRMDNVAGKTMDSIRSSYENLGKTVHLSEKALSQLMTMQVFDIICGQTDRHEGNYFLQTREENGKIIIDSICGIDNDMSFGDLTYNDIMQDTTKIEGSFVGTNMMKIEDTKGNPLLLGLSDTMAEKILALSPTILDATFGGLLSENERNALKDRVKSVQQVILKIKKHDKEAVKKDPPEEKILMKEDKDWEKLKGRLEAMETRKFDQTMSKRTYVSSLMIGKPVEQIGDYFSWSQYVTRSKNEFFDVIDQMQKLSKEGNLEEIRKVAAPLKEWWLYPKDHDFRNKKRDVSYQAMHRELMAAVKAGDLKKMNELIDRFKAVKL